MPESAICGSCGRCDESDPKTALCVCGADWWIQLSDFRDDDLADYVANSASRLKVNVQQLYEAVRDHRSLHKPKEPDA
jgi:hypothetical protein